MKRWKAKVGAVVAVAALVSGIGTTAASAQGAEVQKGFFDGGPVFTPLGTGTIENSNYVQTPSGNWSVTVHGTLNDLDNAPNRAMRWTQDTLATFCFQPGDVFTLVVTPNGNINLSCKNP